MQTKVKAPVYAKKLRARLAELRKRRAQALKEYELAVSLWRTNFCAWLRDTGQKRVDEIKKSELRAYNGKYAHRPGFDVNEFFRDAPRPPIYPDDRQIRGVVAVLRLLGISGQSAIHVGTADITKLFSDDADLEDDG